MNYSLIDYFRAFHDLKQRLNLSASAQATYLSLLGEFNAARFPDRMSISDRQLQALAGLKSVATIHDAKRILKNHGLIDFSKGNVTTYTLATEHLPNTNRTVTEQLPNSCRAAGGSSYIRVRGDGDIDLDLSSSSSTRVRDTSKVDITLEYWDELNGGRLSFEHQSEIAAWVERYGVDWVTAAMREASDANGNRFGLSMKLLRAVVQRKSEGGKKREQSHRPAAGRRYDLSGTDREPDWLKGSDSKTQGAFGGDNAANLQTIRR